MGYVFPAPPQAALPVRGGGLFPVRRIFCVGKNYPDHVRELGGDPARNPPVFFTKPADAAIPDGTVIPYPPATENLHFEGELVVALKGHGRNIAAREDAQALIFGQAAGCDLTRRDLQAAAKAAGAPWDSAKAFDFSAPVGPIARIEDVPSHALETARIALKVNGVMRQNGALAEMIFDVPTILIALSRLFELRPGDLVFTGTPDGVGPLAPGDQLEIAIDPLPRLSFSIGPKL